MRKIVASLFISLDGVVQDPYKWQAHFDEDMGAAMNEQIAEVDTILLGRKTYQEWAPYWSSYTGGEDRSFADYINNNPKYIASTTLDEATFDPKAWQHSHLIVGDLSEALNDLKQQSGKTICVAGSPTLVHALLQLDLLDELTLLVHPVIAGEGQQRLFQSNDPLKHLTLTSSSTTRTGTLILTYKTR